MQSAEEFEYVIEKCFDRESDGCFTRDDPREDAAKLISARDAEWQARVDKLETTIKLQENMLRIYNEEFTKQGHRLFLVQARVKKLEAALSRIVGMSGDVDRCKCGRPTGIPAIVACSRAALGREA